MKRIAHRLVPKATHAALLHAGMLAAGSAMAVPGLQLNFTGGIYDPAPSETVVFSGASATLNAYLLASTRNTLDDTYYLAIALTPQISTPSNLGSFTIEGTTVNVTADMVFGTLRPKRWAAMPDTTVATWVSTVFTTPTTTSTRSISTACR